MDRLHRFSPDGRLLWSYAPEDRLSFRGGAYGPPWTTWNLSTYRSSGGAKIAWSVHHYTWWPSMLITFDGAGRRLGTFVNSGWIAVSAGTPDGRHLVLAGMSNAHRSYFLAVLDAERPTGTSPEAAGSSTECVGCPPGGPLHYYVFPRADISAQFAYPLDPPSLVLFGDGRIQVQVLETSGPAVGATIYDFGSDFDVGRVRVSDSFDEWHRRLESAGTLRHPVRECPDRQHREIRHWTPDAGWRMVRTDVR